MAINEKRPRRGRGRTLRILPQPPPWGCNPVQTPSV